MVLTLSTLLVAWVPSLGVANVTPVGIHSVGHPMLGTIGRESCRSVLYRSLKKVN